VQNVKSLGKGDSREFLEVRRPGRCVMVQRLEEALRVLGIPANSGPEQVAEAYRRLARATHPDVSADPDAAARFATLAAAYRLASASARSDSAHHPAVNVEPGADAPTREGGWPRRRPPIVAGPVVVRPFDDSSRRG